MNFPLLSKAISIHALREEGDHRPQRIPRRGDISIHALREEGDIIFSLALSRMSNFYPRPPRGGRRSGCATRTPCWYFYPRPPRGGRQAEVDSLFVKW